MNCARKAEASASRSKQSVPIAPILSERRLIDHPLSPCTFTHDFPSTFTYLRLISSLTNRTKQSKTELSLELPTTLISKCPIFHSQPISQVPSVSFPIFSFPSLCNPLETDFCLCHSTEIAFAEFITDVFELYPDYASQ